MNQNPLLHPIRRIVRMLPIVALLIAASFSSFAQSKQLTFSPTSLSFSVLQDGSATAKTSVLSSSRGTPVVSLTKPVNSAWLKLPTAKLGSLSFAINAVGLAPGIYTATVVASAQGYKSGSLQVRLEVKPDPSLPSLSFTSPTKSVSVEQGRTQTMLDFISTSNSTPVTAYLKASGSDGSVPSWVTVNGSVLNNFSYTTGSEITFTFDAGNLSTGTHKVKIVASSTGYNRGSVDVTLTVKAGTTGTLTNIKVNFQDAATIPPTGWLRDYGQAFGQRTSAYQGTNNIYGWIRRTDLTPVDLTLNGRKRSSPADILLATLMHMQGNHITTFSGTKVEGIWEAQVVNGVYDVTVSVGDATVFDSRHYINVEGVPAITNFLPTSTTPFKNATVTVSVSDGLLTLDAIGGTNTKINYVVIQPSTTSRPSVIAINPEAGSLNVSENTSVSTSILSLPNGGINNSTITNTTVFLTEFGNETTHIAANVNGTGGGDAITLVPSAPLKLNTTYYFNITTGVKDLTGASFVPYKGSFTTTSVSTGQTINAKFTKIALTNTAGRHSSLTIGPDRKLYALTIDGIIKRFVINADGTLTGPELIYSLQDQSGTRRQRLAIGFAFAPTATATNLVAYVTHSSFVFQNGPDWDGKLTRLSGANLQTAQDILINLPRSVKDHLTNSIAFGPDRALYFTQGSNSAMGKADLTWGNREEHLLSAAVLRLDLTKLTTLPLNVKTSEGGGTYNPFSSGAALTIYASGVRNAYDLVWHSNGKLYVPTNGSAAGGNTPASVSGRIRPDGTAYNGPYVPALSNVQQTQKDFLFRVVQGGYYGHPNPLRGEFALNGANPTSAIDPAQVDAYPIGTAADANYRRFAFDFQANKSPNGAIEYRHGSFNGALKGKLMVVRYSQHDDIITLTPGGTNSDIVSYIEGSAITGFTGFVDPLDLVEDTTKGNIYVSEYGGDGKITLLKPQSTTTTSAVVAEATYTNPPIADVNTRNGTYANQNFGLDTSLAVKTINTTTGLTRSTYLKFPLAGVNNIVSAKLRIFGRNPDNNLSATLSLYGLENDSWTETGITFNNAPAVSGTAITTFAVNGSSRYFEFDVTSFVAAQFAKDKIASFVIRDPSNQNKLITFNSREHATNPPELILTTTALATTSNASLFIENLDRFPSNETFVASRIHFPWTRDTQEPKIYNKNHDTLKIRIHNKGVSTLQLKNLVRSNGRNWKIIKLGGAAYDSATAFPRNIASGSFTDLWINFVEPSDLNVRIKQFNDILYVITNDDKTPSKILNLNGLWQRAGESSREPRSQEMVNTFGFKTNIGFTATDPDLGNPKKPKGDEVISSHYVKADVNKPITVIQIAAYHGCCRQSETLRWYAKTTSTPVLNSIVTHIAVDGQSLLPRKGNSGLPGDGSFNPSGPFGLKVGSNDWTDTLRNPGRKIGLRVWKAKDAAGRIIPHEYIIANDYLGTQFTNYDYNDNLYYIKNIRPESGTGFTSALGSTPSAVDFGENVLGTSKTIAVALKNLGQTYGSTPSDPPVTIKSIKIVGANFNEFSATLPSPAILNAQQSGTINVKFSPVAQGLKIADLLISYDNAKSPLRIPLYGIAKANGVTVTAHRRIKSGSTTSVTVNGKVWSAETGFAFDNLEPYSNPLVTSIAATDEDVLYTREQSSNGDKRPFNYRIPLKNGNYVVRLHFAEIYWGAPGSGVAGSSGSRVMSVSMENQLKLANFDICAEVGTAAAIIKNIPVTVQGDTLNINFSASVNRPMLSAIEVYSFSQPVTTAVVALEEQDVDSTVERTSIYPNPLRDNFYVKFPTTHKGRVNMSVADARGQVFSVGTYTIGHGASPMRVDISRLNLRPGIYFLKLEYEDGKYEVIKLMTK